MRTKLQIVNPIDDDFILDGEEPDMERRIRKENDIIEPKFIYLGKETNKRNFRGFVYAKDKKRKICNNYDEFKKAIDTCEWFESIEAMIAKEESKKVEPEIVIEEQIQEIIEEEKPKKRKYVRREKEEQIELTVMAEEKENAIKELPSEDLPNDEVIEYGTDR